MLYNYDCGDSSLQILALLSGRDGRSLTFQEQKSRLVRVGHCNGLGRPPASECRVYVMTFCMKERLHGTITSKETEE